VWGLLVNASTKAVFRWALYDYVCPINFNLNFQVSASDSSPIHHHNMSSRFHRDQRSALFANYDAARSSSQSPSRSGAGSRPASGYGYTPPAPTSSPYAGYTNSSSPGPSTGPSFSAYPTSNGSASQTQGQYRAATPNAKGQYSDAVLSELESQNDEQVQGMIGKVMRLKDLTVQIGDEIRDSTTLAEKMNEGFEGTSRRLRGTMKRMLRMAERTGVGWRVWLGFFAAVVLLFWWVWLF